MCMNILFLKHKFIIKAQPIFKSIDLSILELFVIMYWICFQEKSSKRNKNMQKYLERDLSID